MTDPPRHAPAVSPARTVERLLDSPSMVVALSFCASITGALATWLITDRTLASISIGGAVLSGVLAVSLPTRKYSRKTVGAVVQRTRAIERLVHQTREIHSAQLSRVLYFAKPGIDTAGSVSALRSDVSEILESTRTGPPGLAQSIATAPHTRAGNLEARRSATYEAMDPAQSPTRVGRIGGARERTEPDPYPALAHRTAGISGLGAMQNSSPAVAAIVPRPQSNATSGSSVLLALPHTVRTIVSTAPLDVFFINAEAFVDGPWSGTLNAAGSHAYKELWESLAHARRRQIPIIVDSSNIQSSHFTEELLQYADATSSQSHIDVGHGEGVFVPSLSFLSSVSSDEGWIR